MDKKRKTLLITVAAVLLVVAAFLLLRRSQPLGELIPAPETARVDGLFCISTIVPTPVCHGTGKLHFMAYDEHGHAFFCQLHDDV